MHKWRTMVFGLGNMGRNHVKVIDQDPRFQLIGIVEPHVSELPKMENSQPEFYTHFNQVHSENIDCAIVATPTETHYEVVKALLEQNIHVLVEKPAASTYAQCSRLTELAKDKRVKLAVGNVERGNPVVSALKKVIASGVLGLPVHLNSVRAGGFPSRVKEGNNVVLDLAVHDLDVIRMLLGPLQVISSMGHSTRIPRIYDTAEISIMSRDGITGSVHVNWLSPQKIRQIRVTGTDAVCEIDYLTQSCRIFGQDLKRSEAVAHAQWSVGKTKFCDVIDVPVVAAEPLKVQLDQFAALLDGRPHGLAVEDELNESVILVEQALDQLGEPVMSSFFQEPKKWRPAFTVDAEPSLN